MKIQTSPSKRVRLTLPPGWMDKLETCAELAGVPITQEASMLLCAGVQIALKRWKQLGLLPDNQCDRCGKRGPDVSAYREPKTLELDPAKWPRLCDSCAYLAAVQSLEPRDHTMSAPPPAAPPKGD